MNPEKSGCKKGEMGAPGGKTFQKAQTKKNSKKGGQKTRDKSNKPLADDEAQSHGGHIREKGGTAFEKVRNWFSH